MSKRHIETERQTKSREPNRESGAGQKKRLEKGEGVNKEDNPELSLCAIFFKNVTIGYYVYIVVPFCHIAPRP